VTRLVRDKIAQNIPSPIHFLPKLMHHFYRENSRPNIWATFVIFEKLAKVNNLKTNILNSQFF
jgi:hypothetical protein